MEALIKAVMFLVLLVTLAIWAVVGFIFWIPLLTRATTIFALLLLPAALTHQDLSGIRHGLEAACGFYFRGFRSAVAAIYEPSESVPVQIHFWRVLIEMFWAAAFWLVTLYFIQPVIVAPVLAWLSSAFTSIYQLVHPHA
jgi:hypothetical protein